jgi:hypothetical protein
MGELPICFLCGEKEATNKLLDFYICDDCEWQRSMVEKEPEKWRPDNCRFCGSDDLVMCWGSDGIDDICSVHCLTCQATGPSKYMEVDAIAAWNAHAPQQRVMVDYILPLEPDDETTAPTLPPLELAVQQLTQARALLGVAIVNLYAAKYVHSGAMIGEADSAIAEEINIIAQSCKPYSGLLLNNTANGVDNG